MSTKEKSPVYELIAKLCKEKGTSPTALCTEITGSRGNLPTWQKGNINPVSLTKIADYFNVSTDYLLSRTDEPARITNNVSVNNPQNFNGTQNNGIVQNSDEKASSDDERLLEMIKSLDLIDRSRIIVMIDEMRKGA